jgi:hypothetical protein
MNVRTIQSSSELRNGSCIKWSALLIDYENPLIHSVFLVQWGIYEFTYIQSFIQIKLKV